MWLLVCRNHRIIQHLALWSSRAPFLSSLLTISHQIIRFGDYFNFRQDLSLSVQFASWMNSLKESGFFSSKSLPLSKHFLGVFGGVNEILCLRWTGPSVSPWTPPDERNRIFEQREFFCLERCEKASRVTLPLITHNTTKCPSKVSRWIHRWPSEVHQTV